MSDIVEHYNEIWKSMGIPPYLYSLFSAMEQLPLAQGCRVLDIACGNGTFGEWFTKKLNAEMYGLDISPVAIDMCREKGYKQVALTDLDRDNFPFDDNSFDLVILSAVLEHVMSPEQVLRQAWQKLRPGGFVVVLTPNVSWIVNRLLFLLGRWDHRLMGGTRGHISYMNKRQLQQAMTSAGFSDMDWSHSVLCVAGESKVCTQGISGAVIQALNNKRVLRWQSLWAFNFIVFGKKPLSPDLG